MTMQKGKDVESTMQKDKNPERITPRTRMLAHKGPFNRVDWEQVIVLDHSTNLHVHEWLTLEACHIRRRPLPWNRDRGVLPAIV